MTYLRSRENVGLSPVDPDGDLGAGGAEFLEQSAVRTNPQVLLRYFHLKQGRNGTHAAWKESRGCDYRF